MLVVDLEVIIPEDRKVLSPFYVDFTLKKCMFEKKGRVRDSMLSVFLLEFFLCSNYLHKTSSSLYPFKFLFNSQVESKLLIFLYVTTTLPVYKVRSSRFRVCLYVTVQVREGPERLRPCYPLHQSFNPTVVCPYRMLRSSP